MPKSKVHWINFVVGFAHLFFFRLCGSGNGWPWSAFPFPPSHTNAIQMIMTLKLMGLAFEVHEETHKTELEKKYKHVYPNVLDIFHYAFSHAGILTGITFLPVPFLTYIYNIIQIPNTEHTLFPQSMCSTKSSIETLQNLPYFIYLYENPKLLFPFFILCYFIFSHNECPGLC